MFSRQLPERLRQILRYCVCFMYIAASLLTLYSLRGLENALSNNVILTSVKLERVQIHPQFGRSKKLKVKQKFNQNLHAFNCIKLHERAIFRDHSYLIAKNSRRQRMLAHTRFVEIVYILFTLSIQHFVRERHSRKPRMQHVL